MKQPHVLLKVAAIVSSVSLLGAMVAYHAGAFDSFRGDKPSTLGGSKSKTMIVPSSTETPDPQQIPNTEATPILSERDLMIMSSSKSMPFIVPPATDKTKTPPTPPTVIMSGSKASSAPIIRFPEIVQPNLPPPATVTPPPSK